MKGAIFVGESCWYFFKTHVLPDVVLYDTYLKQLPLCCDAMPEFKNWQLEFYGRDFEKNISLVITMGTIVPSGIFESCIKIRCGTLQVSVRFSRNQPSFTSVITLFTPQTSSKFEYEQQIHFFPISCCCRRSYN